MAAVRQPDRLAAAVEPHPPQLVRAVDRRREQDRLAVRGRDDARALGQRHVAVEGRVGLQAALGEQVRATTRAGVGAVRREGPDPDPVVAAREPLAGDEDRGAVPRPGGPGEQRVGAADDRGHLARRDVHDEHRRATVEVRLRPAVGGERDAGAVGAPGGLALGRRPGDQRSCLARLGVDHPQVRVVVVDEADAVVLVRQPVDVAVIRQRRLAGLGLRRASPAAGVLGHRRAARARQDGQRAAVGRPRHVVDATRQVGQAPRLAAVEREQEQLVAVEPVLGLLRPVGLLLDQQPPVGDEGEGPAVRREARSTVRPRPDRDLAGRRRAIGRCQPDRVPVAVAADGRPLDAERDEPPVGRQARVERDGQAVQVVGTSGTRHGLLR